MIEHITVGLVTHRPLTHPPGLIENFWEGWRLNIQRLGIVDEVIVIEMLDPGEELELMPSMLPDGYKYTARNNDPPTDITRKETLEAAQNDWVLFLDDDERMSEGMLRFIDSLATEDPAPSHDWSAICFGREDYIWYHDLWRYIPANGNDPQIRLVDRRRARWHGRPHEVPEVDGVLLTINRPDVKILHYRDYEKIVKKTQTCNDLHPEFKAMQDAYVERVNALLGI